MLSKMGKGAILEFSLVCGFWGGGHSFLRLLDFLDPFSKLFFFPCHVYSFLSLVMLEHL